MTALVLRDLVADLRAAGIPYEPEVDRLPFPVRHHAALTVALGHACIMEERLICGPTKRTLRALQPRIIDGLRWIEALGMRSQCSAQRSWFEPRRFP